MHTKLFNLGKITTRETKSPFTVINLQTAFILSINTKDRVLDCDLSFFRAKRSYKNRLTMPKAIP